MPKHQIFNQAIVLIACLVAFQSNATGQEVTPFVEADPQITQLNELAGRGLSLIHISEPTRRYAISYAVFCLKKKK